MSTSLSRRQRLRPPRTNRERHSDATENPDTPETFQCPSCQQESPAAYFVHLTDPEKQLTNKCIKCRIVTRARSIGSSLVKGGDHFGNSMELDEVQMVVLLDLKARVMEWRFTSREAGYETVDVYPINEFIDDDIMNDTLSEEALRQAWESERPPQLLTLNMSSRTTDFDTPDTNSDDDDDNNDNGTSTASSTDGLVVEEQAVATTSAHVVCSGTGRLQKNLKAAREILPLAVHEQVMGTLVEIIQAKLKEHIAEARNRYATLKRRISEL